MLRPSAKKPTPCRREVAAPCHIGVVPAQQYEAGTRFMIEHFNKMGRGRKTTSQIIGDALKSNPITTEKILDIYATRREAQFGWMPLMTTEQAILVTDEMHAVATAMALSDKPYATEVTSDTRIHLTVSGHDKVLTGKEIATLLDAKDAKIDEAKTRKWEIQQLLESQVRTIQGVIDNPVGSIKSRGRQGFPPAPSSVFDHSFEMSQLREVFEQDQAGLGAEWVQVAGVDTTDQAAEQNMTGWSDRMTGFSDDDEVWDVLDDIEMKPAPAISCSTSGEEDNTAPPTPCNTSEEDNGAEEDNDGYAGSCEDDGSADAEIVD